MLEALKNNLKLETAYLVNSIIYSLKQIPLIKKILPQSLYKSTGLKIFAGIIMVLIKTMEIFLYKLLYIVFLVAIPAKGISELHGDDAHGAFFLHILFFMTIIGAFLNNHLFDAEKHRYYAVILMRMNARDHTIAYYSVYLVKLIIGFLPFTIISGKLAGAPLWSCFVLPFGIAGIKLIYNAVMLYNYKKKAGNFDIKSKARIYVTVFLLLIASYIPCLAGFPVPAMITIVLFCLAAVGGIAGFIYMIGYDLYRPIYQETLNTTLIDNKAVAIDTRKKNVENTISADTSITSSKEGFEFLNDLFVKRHAKLLWKSTMIISAICSVLLLVFIGIALFAPDSRSSLKAIPLKGLPYLTFIMYFLNRGTSITQALFMNCDHSLLTYSVYKQRTNILKMFRIRLREIIKINIVPAVIIAVGLTALLAVCGGSGDPLDYIILLISVPCISIFFSVHYLTIYYLLQPYNAGTEMKNGTYTLITTVTYMGCYFLMQCRFPTHTYGFITIVTSILYCLIACLLVYRFAPNSFRIRN